MISLRQQQQTINLNGLLYGMHNLAQNFVLDTPIVKSIKSKSIIERLSTIFPNLFLEHIIRMLISVHQQSRV